MRLVSCLFLPLASLVSMSTARADEGEDVPARDFHRPHDPKVFTAMTVGGAGHGGPARERERGVEGGELTLRMDIPAFSPLWLSAEGRVLLSRSSPEPTLDLRAGYELAFYDAPYSPKFNRRYPVRALLRPFVGLRPMRYAAAPPAPIMATAYPVEVGADWSVIMRRRPGENRVATGTLVGIYDAARREGGVEMSFTYGLGVSEHALAGPFVGGRFGYLPSVGVWGGLHLGLHYEL